MKNSIKILTTIITITIIFNCQKGNAQDKVVTGGIFLTEQNFYANKLSYPLNDPDKLQLNEFFGSKSIAVVKHGEKTKLLKRNIYGYRLHNQNFRFFNNDSYRIVDTAGFMLYSRQRLVQQNKGYLPVETFFFSVDARQPVLNLTVANLSNSFSAQAGFRYSPESLFNKDTDLMAYDKQTQQYKIKYLYLQQKQPKTAHTTL
ncbi:MAG: hypothetical protein JWR76_332 [Mucilaginibacter sp.]|nr:hypothetical protein [Mucilaginibacter sp.]